MLRLPAPPPLARSARTAPACASRWRAAAAGAGSWRPSLWPPASLLAGAARAALRRTAAPWSLRSPALARAVPRRRACVGGARLDALAAPSSRPRRATRARRPRSSPTCRRSRRPGHARRARSGRRRQRRRRAAHLRLRLEEGQTSATTRAGRFGGHAAAARLGAHRAAAGAEPGRFDYGRYLRRRGEHVLLAGRFADLRITGRRGGLRAPRPPAPGLARPPAAGRALAGPRGAAGHGPGRRRGRRRRRSLETSAAAGCCTSWPSPARTWCCCVPCGRSRSRCSACTGCCARLCCCPLVAVYVLLTGASPSIVRAGVAGVVGLLAVLASRPSDGWLLWLAPGGVAAHGEPEHPLRRELPAVVRRGGRAAAARAAAHPRRSVPAGSAARAGRGHHCGQHLHGSRVAAHLRLRVAGHRAGQPRRRVRARADHVPRHAVAAVGS